MEFNKEQNKIIKFKPHGHMLIKGNKETGKTTAIINKIQFLLNNYCIDKNDKILIATYNEQYCNHVSLAYDNIETEKYHQSSFFDEDNSDKLEITTIDSLMLYYFNEYKKKHKKEINIASVTECRDSLIAAIQSVRKKYEKKKFPLLDSNNIEFIHSEILWIKSCGYLKIEDYQNAARIQRSNELSNGTKTLRKNSKQREVMYEILVEYNENLKSINKIDTQDVAILALESAMKKQNKNFTHIFVDDCENFTKVQLEFLKAIYNEKNYSSMTFVLNTDSSINTDAWLIKGRSFSTLGYDMKGKSISLKKPFVKEKITIVEDMIKEDKSNILEVKNDEKIFELDSIEYIDLKRNISHKFIKDPDSLDEIYIQEDGIDEKAEEVVSLPLFNEIAAGSPIPINDSIEENYSLPKEWIRSPKNTFMLKVKGDSMINKNINDGDYVVINNQNTPSVKDVVAVDIEGEATLKTYKIMDGKIVLTPENEKYDPIIIEDQQYSFLGVAVGLVKNA